MKVICFLTLTVILTLAGPMGAWAQEAFLYVAPDKPEIVHIASDAASVIVGSPKYASVTMDNPRTLLIVPRAEGATSLTVLNKNGDIILEKRIIIGAANNKPNDKYVRIRRACTSAMPGCRPSQIFYCPDGCSDISLDTPAPLPEPTGEQTSVSVPLSGPPPLPAGAENPIAPISETQLEQPQ